MCFALQLLPITTTTVVVVVVIPRNPCLLVRTADAMCTLHYSSSTPRSFTNTPPPTQLVARHYHFPPSLLRSLKSTKNVCHNVSTSAWNFSNLANITSLKAHVPADSAYVFRPLYPYSPTPRTVCTAAPSPLATGLARTHAHRRRTLPGVQVHQPVG